MDVLAFATLAVTGFTACSEFGSYAWVHPVIRHLPPVHHIQVEQGLVRSFGRAMPLLMIASTVLSISYAIRLRAFGGAGVLALAAAVAIVAAVVFTVIFNVPRNASVLRWDPQNPPADWKTQRNTWEFFQGVRSWLLLLGFGLSSAAVCVQLVGEAGR